MPKNATNAASAGPLLRDAKIIGEWFERNA